MAPIELPSSDNPYAAPQHTALIAAQESQLRTTAPKTLIRTVTLWLVVCGAGATPSFIVAMSLLSHPWKVPAMVAGVLIFTAGCIAVDLLVLSSYLAQYPRLRSAVRASYGIRVAISVMLPVGIAVDIFCGAMSTGLTQLLLGGTPADLSIFAIILTVLIQGLLLNVLVWAVVPLIYAIQLLFWKVPESAEPPAPESSPQ